MRKTSRATRNLIIREIENERVISFICSVSSIREIITLIRKR